MQTYSYKRYVFRRDQPALTEVVTLSSDELHLRAGGVGEEAFLRLLSNWNRVSARYAEVHPNNAVYLYCREYPV